LPLTAASPSLALISLQESAGSSGMEPRETGFERHNPIRIICLEEEERLIAFWQK